MKKERKIFFSVIFDFIFLVYDGKLYTIEMWIVVFFDLWEMMFSMIRFAFLNKCSPFWKEEKWKIKKKEGRKTINEVGSR